MALKPADDAGPVAKVAAVERRRLPQPLSRWQNPADNPGITRE